MQHPEAAIDRMVKAKGKNGISPTKAMNRLLDLLQKL